MALRRVWTALALSMAVAPCAALYSQKSPVQELTADNFNSKVLKDDGLWIVEFYAPWCGHCKSLAPDYKKLAEATKGVVNVGAVDADKHQELGQQYGVKGFPTLKLFAADKKKPTDYQGERTAKGMVDAVLREARSMVTGRLNGKGGSGGSGNKKDKKQNKERNSSGAAGKVVELTEDNFDDLVVNGEDSYLVAFTAPWCGHCKALKPAWSEAAQKLGGKVKFGNVDATVHTQLGQRFQVQGYPTIKVFSGTGKSRRDGVDYQGGRSTEDIVAYAMTLAPPPKVLELVDPADFQVCQDEMCIVTLLPSLYDGGAKVRNQLIKSLKAVAKKHSGQLHWFWTPAGEQPALREALMRGSTAYPAVFAVNGAKKLAAPMRSGFDEKNLGKFIIGLSTGKIGQTQTLKTMPAIVDAKKWDGKDAAPVAVDEIPLDQLFGDDEE